MRDQRIAELERAQAARPRWQRVDGAFDDPRRREYARDAKESMQERRRDDREQRQRALDGLRREYAETFDGTDRVTPAIRHGTEPPPREWMQRRLREMFASEQVRQGLFPEYFRPEIVRPEIALRPGHAARQSRETPN